MNTSAHQHRTLWSRNGKRLALTDAGAATVVLSAILQTAAANRRVTAGFTRR